MQSKIYDAIIVGTGASGGWAAKVLAEAGMDILVLDAGPMPDPGHDFAHHEWPYQKDHRGVRIPGEPFGDPDKLPLFWRNHPDHPFTTPPDKPFSWGRSRVVGGRTLHWSRATHRLTDFDFKAARDGLSENWPISYKEIAPFYDRVEAHIGVAAYKEGFEQLPDGPFLPGMPYNCVETILLSTARKLGLDATHRRIAQLSKPHNGRPKCHFCGACRDGCDIGAMFNSLVSTLPGATASGNMTLRPNSVVRSVLTGSDGLATGVSYLDRLTKTEYEARGKQIILAASTLESTRILLNSSKDGLGNSSGTLGRYLMDQIAGASVSGFLPQLKGGPARNDDGKSSGMFIPHSTFRPDPKRDFIGGFCMSGNGGQREFPAHALSTPGYGLSYKEAVRERYPAAARVYMSAGDMLPQAKNRCEINPDQVDAWGIPTLKIICEHGENDRRLFRAGLMQIQEVMDAAGAEEMVVRDRMSPPGGLIHEVGSCRMGSDPKTSVLDPFCRMHDVKNVYVFGGSPFVTTGAHHPTLTIMALTVRGSEHLIEQTKA